MLARPLRIGLAGDPYFWGHLDFDYWQDNGVCLDLLAFTGTSQKSRKDIVLSSDRHSNNRANGTIQQYQPDGMVPQFKITQSQAEALCPLDLTRQYSQFTDQIVAQVLSRIHQHGRNYLSREKIVARYGLEAIRFAKILRKEQIHIENEALLYLLSAPWRNQNELELAIDRLAYYSPDNVLRHGYVRESVYDFSISVRGVFNCRDPRLMIREFVFDILENHTLFELLALTHTNMASFHIVSTQVPRRSRQLVDSAGSQPMKRAA